MSQSSSTGWTASSNRSWDAWRSAIALQVDVAANPHATKPGDGRAPAEPLAAGESRQGARGAGLRTRLCLKIPY
jgi:hypothetical protein